MRMRKKPFGLPFGRRLSYVWPRGGLRIIMGLFDKLFGSYSDRELKRIYPIADKIEALEPDFQKLSDAELRGKTDEFKQRIAEGESLDDILPEAFAAVREAS